MASALAEEEPARGGAGLRPETAAEATEEMAAQAPRPAPEVASVMPAGETPSEMLARSCEEAGSLPAGGSAVERTNKPEANAAVAEGEEVAGDQIPQVDDAAAENDAARSPLARQQNVGEEERKSSSDDEDGLLAQHGDEVKERDCHTEEQLEAPSEEKATATGAAAEAVEPVRVDEDGNPERVAADQGKTGNGDEQKQEQEVQQEDEEDDPRVMQDILEGHLDRYGFATTDESEDRASMSTMSLVRNRQTYVSRVETPKQRKRRIRLETLRAQKWLRMLANWDVQLTKKRPRLERRVRKGIPDCFRDRAWPLLVAAHAPDRALLGGDQVRFDALLSRANVSVDPEVDKIRESISRDIGRTFPRHVIFQRKNGIGQKSLTNVLRAYAMVDVEVGYCQGMGFIAGMLLGYLPQHRTFEMFWPLMLCEPWCMAELYKPGMPGSQLVLAQFEELLKKHVPDVAAHLERENIVPSMYATQWFITVFTYNFPFDVVVRVWDIFLIEGWVIVHQVAIAIMKQNRQQILRKSFEQILEYFRGIPTTLDPQVIIELALKVPISSKDLQKLNSG
ncbi:Ecotropic viral integration site 5 protein homolog (EVI-5) (Neuroblastoma stage 4S gene protein) [Durusdinium trenchii]|uniref:Ecotropic viral integration site 5 protein homolog (EVI-5) (Neuroblastoma stage 4S gene protein) n=1 Tax=Durusdinium trenchii TaxID=1381693 RepID=A0ABP0K0Z1_9DINO